MAYDQEMMAAPEPMSAVRSGRNLLHALWKRKALVLLGAVTTTVVAALYYAAARPVYESTAQVLVVKKTPEVVTGAGAGPTAVEDYVATQQAILGSPIVVARAVEKSNLAALTSFADEENVADAISKALQVKRNKATGGRGDNVLILKLRARDPEEAARTLDAIIESYKEFLDQTYRSSTESTVKLIAQARDVLEKEITTQEQAYRTFRKTSPQLLFKSKDGSVVSATQERITSLELKVSALLARKAEVQSYLAALDEAAREQGDLNATILMASEWVARFDGIDRASNRASQQTEAQDKYFALSQELEKLMEVRGRKHPDVVAARERLESAKKFLARPYLDWRSPSAAADARTDPHEQLRVYRSFFRQHLEHLKVVEANIEGVLKKEYDTARAVVHYELQDEDFRRDLDRKQKMFDTVLKRLEDANLIKDVGGFDATPLAAPDLGRKYWPRASLLFPLAALLGLCLGTGLAYVAELTDQRFRSVDEIRQRLALPIIGQVPALPAEVTNTAEAAPDALAPTVLAHHRPLSAVSEAYRGVRTALYFSAAGTHRVIQVTSPNGGDGKSTLAANLAVSIAQSGQRVLLVDADLRKPQVHRLFGLSADVGLGSIMAGLAEPVEAIQPAQIEGLSVLPCGPIPPNPAELLTSPRFQELLELLRGQYDYVLVDTPPLLVVTDPSIVAARVDGVILVVRPGRDTRAQAGRARDTLVGLGVNVLGIVVNDLDPRELGGYGYGYGAGYYRPQAGPGTAPLSADRPAPTSAETGGGPSHAD